MTCHECGVVVAPTLEAAIAHRAEHGDTLIHHADVLAKYTWTEDKPDALFEDVPLPFET